MRWKNICSCTMLATATHERSFVLFIWKKNAWKSIQHIFFQLELCRHHMRFRHASSILCKLKQIPGGWHFCVEVHLKVCLLHQCSLVSMHLAPREEPTNPPREQDDESEQQCKHSGFEARALHFPPRQLCTQQVTECLAGNPSFLPSFHPSFCLSIPQFIYHPLLSCLFNFAPCYWDHQCYSVTAGIYCRLACTTKALQ